MDINLTIYDMEIFLDKYTRFMTKDIYISNKMYCNFLKQYDYLYERLSKDKFLYSDNKLYKRVMDIKFNRKKLIRLHNQKYLKGAIKRYEDFFDGVDEKMSLRDKMIILLEEDNVYTLGNKNYESLIVGKIKYLKNYKNYLDDSILVLADDSDKAVSIRNRFINDGIDVNVFDIKEYSKEVLLDNKVIDDNKRYDILITYIINDLFRDKNKFDSFYKVFSKYIYLNKDYKDYDSFRDYHNYMYKRKYLSSNLSLKKFNEKEIGIRKKYLRTIRNEVMNERNEVDIANFLYLNSIDYVYDRDSLTFNLKDNVRIKYIDKAEGKKEDGLDDVIYLYKDYLDDRTYLGVLVYELVKRRFPMELVLEEDLYNELRDTSIYNYFSEFVSKYLISLIRCCEDNDLDNIDVSIREEVLSLYMIYSNYLEEHNLITEKELLRSIGYYINNSKYKYLFLISDIDIDTNVSLFNVSFDYKEHILIKENIKLLYDYKRYLYDNQFIPITNTYLNRKEVNSLTMSFLKDNLDIINGFLEKTKNDIKVVEYDDSNRLLVYRNISNSCLDILNSANDKYLLAFDNLKDVKILVNNNFTRLDKNTLLTNSGIKVVIDEVLKIDKICDNIILPYLIKDRYHDGVFNDDYRYNMKVMLYAAIVKCKGRLIILCPNSKIKEISRVLPNIF